MRRAAPHSPHTNAQQRWVPASEALRATAEPAVVTLHEAAAVSGDGRSAIWDAELSAGAESGTHVDEQSHHAACRMSPVSACHYDTMVWRNMHRP